MEGLTSASLCPTPPMGWNSWDCYGASVREDEVVANAEFLARHLAAHGWNTVVVDIQWSEPTADSSRYHAYAPLCQDPWSRLVPAVNRFPSAAQNQGFRPLADRIHALGLKFGIHIMRGIPRQAVHNNTPIEGSRWTAREVAHPNSICPWNTDMYGLDPAHPGAQDYYDSIFRLYASWGVDFVKVDDVAASRLYGPHLAELALLHRAVERCGRPMVLSLSPGPAAVDHAETYQANAQMWRITDDFWDRWELLKDMFDRCEQWFPHVVPGSWPDCDMLPLGHLGLRSVDGGGEERQTRFTPDEQRTLMSLWCLFRSPLFFGGELRDCDPATLALLTNRDVLRVHREGRSPRPLTRGGDQRLWRTEVDGAVVLGLFNLADHPASINGAELEAYAGRATDQWTGTLLERADWTAPLPPHGCRLVRLEP